MHIHTFLHNRLYWLMLLTGMYCVIAVMMNYLCMKPLSFGTSFIWMDGGLLISWLVFLISNIITEVYGRRMAIMVSLMATVLAAFVSVLALVEVYLPTLPSYQGQAEHFSYIFSNGPRTILSSAIAFFVGNVVNVSIISRMKQSASDHRRMRILPFWWRAVFSTIIGQTVDNCLFQTLAFAPVSLSIYEMYWHDIFTAALTSTAFETTIEAIFVPWITFPLTKYIIKWSNNTDFLLPAPESSSWITRSEKE